MEGGRRSRRRSERRVWVRHAKGERKEGEGEGRKGCFALFSPAPDEDPQSAPFAIEGRSRLPFFFSTPLPEAVFEFAFLSWLCRKLTAVAGERASQSSTWP